MPRHDEDDERTLPQQELGAPTPGHMFWFDVFPVDPHDATWFEEEGAARIEIIEAHSSAPACADSTQASAATSNEPMHAGGNYWGQNDMSAIRIAPSTEPPDWLLHFQARGRTPDYQSADRWVFRTTAQDREQFESLAGADGVALLIEDGCVSDWDVLHEEAFLQAAGSVFRASHEDDDGKEVFVMEMESTCMRLIEYHDGALSWFDTGLVWVGDRFRAFPSVDVALADPDETWFEAAGQLVSISSTVHTSEEIAKRLSWLDDAEPHEFTINGEPWRYERGTGVTRVAASTTKPGSDEG